MTRYTLPGDQMSGTYDSGEEWRIKADANGIVAPKDEQIAACLQKHADDPSSAIQAVKGK